MSPTFCETKNLAKGLKSGLSPSEPYLHPLLPPKIYIWDSGVELNPYPLGTGLALNRKAFPRLPESGDPSRLAPLRPRFYSSLAPNGRGGTRRVTPRHLGGALSHCQRRIGATPAAGRLHQRRGSALGGYRRGRKRSVGVLGPFNGDTSRPGLWATKPSDPVYGPRVGSEWRRPGLCTLRRELIDPRKRQSRQNLELARTLN